MHPYDGDELMRASTPPPTRPPHPHGGKRALVLCGGGITGLTYEVGALRALDDVLVDMSVNDFDIFVGTSAGSIISALLANAISPTEIALSLHDPRSQYQLPSPWVLYQPNFKEMFQRSLRLPRAVWEFADLLLKTPQTLNLFDLLDAVTLLLPSGLCDPAGLMNYLHTILTSRTYTDDFSQLDSDLFVVTCALDTEQRVVFSRHQHPHVPISQAVTASSAVPMLFKPVRIDGIDYVDGGTKGISAIDVAVDNGAKLIVVINPIVPVDAEEVPHPEHNHLASGTRLASLGFRSVYNQVFRGMLHDSLVDHIQLVRERHPDVDILLIEPRSDDDKMFFHELMSFSARLMVLQHGYESVSNGLSDSWDAVSKLFPRHGIHVTRRVIDMKPLQVPPATVDSPHILQRILRQTVFQRRTPLQILEDGDIDTAS
ncbi:MAG: patatin-like phospholipase family protein [Candidatus Dormibacteria bacterium]